MRVLYSKISLGFDDEFSSDGRAGLMLLLSLSLLLAKNLFVLSDLAGKISSSQVLGNCITWSRGKENTVNISSLQIPGCSFPVSGALQGLRRGGKYVGG